MRLALVCLWLVACEDRAAREKLAPLAGERDVSNVLVAPAGAAWRSAVVHTRLGRGNANDDVFVKSWVLATDLIVTYPDGTSWRRLAGVRDREVGVERVELLAKQRYELRLAGTGIELRTVPGAWAPTFLPRPPYHAIDAGALRALLPAVAAPSSWIAVERGTSKTRRDHDGARYMPWIAQWDLAGGSPERSIIFFDCDNNPSEPEHPICTELPAKIGRFGARLEPGAVFVRAGRIVACVDAPTLKEPELRAIAASLDLEQLARVDSPRPQP